MRPSRWVVAGILVLAACAQGNVFTLEPGTCFDDVDAFFEEDSEGVSDVPTVDCEDPHDNEVYATFDVADGEFPGVDALVAEADERCLDVFEDYVGASYADSRFVYSYLLPTEDSWGQGDREIVCFLYDLNLEKLEGSAEGSGE
ncbi:MAG: septum formation family protein [Actinobacteria bacterium]|nr:septum formation family protein [Actinomycetota bacterium]